MIKAFFKSSVNMEEVSDGAVQLIISSIPGVSISFFNRNAAPDRRPIVKNNFSVPGYSFCSVFLFDNAPFVRAIYHRNIAEMERVLAPNGVFILNIGNADITAQYDTYGTELHILYPYLIAEDIIQISNFRMRRECLSIIKDGKTRRIERWFIFSKTSAWKENRMRTPLILKGKTNHATTATLVTPFPESIIEFFIKKFTRETDWVLDAYAGSGTLGIVASRLNRNAFLYENDPEIWKKLQERIANRSFLWKTTSS